MEFQIGNVTFMLPDLHITIMAIIIIYLLARWSKELEASRFKVFFYFLISAYIMPIYSRSTPGSEFQLWFPIGFVLVFFYLFRSERNHSAKMKASILGLAIALYQIILHYVK